MSSLKSLSSSPIHNLPGECLWDTKSNFDSQYETSQVLSQSAHPQLYNKIGKIIDGANTPGLSFTAPTASSSYELIYAGGLFVYLAGFGAMATSTNGISWNVPTSNTSSQLYGLTYGNNLYVYAGAGGVLATSTDANTWFNRTSNTTLIIYALTYGNNLYVYGGGSGVLATSTDAITWSNRTSGTASAIRALTYGNGLYVYGGVGGVLATSTDAITWTARTSNTTATIYDIIYQNNLYVYGSAAEIATSTDAITWTVVSSGSIIDLTYGDGLYCGVGGGGLSSSYGKYSTDGITWTQFPLGVISTASPGGITYGNGVFVYLTQYSTDYSRSSIKTFFTYNPSTEFVLPAPYSITDVSKNYIKGT